jgi:antitoxin VapB
MSLNIKNEETHELVRKLAELTGESLTEAVTVAVRERLARVRNTEERVRARADAIRAMAHEIARRIPPEVRNIDYDKVLYDDELGLPR